MSTERIYYRQLLNKGWRTEKSNIETLRQQRYKNYRNWLPFPAPGAQSEDIGITRSNKLSEEATQIEIQTSEKSIPLTQEL